MILLELFPYASVVYDILMILYILTIVGTIIIILSENRNPVKSLAWATVLVLLPMVGIVLYLFFGRSMRSRHMISRRGWRKLKSTDATLASEHIQQASEGSQQQMHLARTLVEARIHSGNHIQVFTDGYSKFESLKQDIKEAKRFILLQYYIFENDHLGREISDLLIAKVKEGVKVRVLYDHVGSYTINAAFFKRMRRAGVMASPFLKITFASLADRLNWRNHRKLVVIDGNVGYIGGMNIADRYVSGDNGRAPWRDTHLRIQGPAVVGLFNSFAVDWKFTNKDLLELPEDAIPHPYPDGVTMQIVPSGPTAMWNGNSFVVLRAISVAKKCLYIQTPYFLPNDALLKALQVAALSGVDVRVMIPRRTDSIVLRHASGSYIKECLLAGIKIYLYDNAMLHSKVLIVDDEFVTTGSSNFDFRSFEHNFECNALIYDTAFNHRMKEIFINDQHHSTRLILSHWRRRPLHTKALESLARLLAPIL